MFHRAVHDLPSPDRADLDTPAITAAAESIEMAERHLGMLKRLGEISMGLAESLGRKAQAVIDGEPGPSEPALDPIAAFNKMALTVRRTIALEARLAAGVKAARERLIAQRDERRESARAAKLEAVLFGVHDAYAADCPKPVYVERIENLMEDVEEHLRECDDFAGWLDRPVGETVQRLCAQLNLDPDSCRQEADAWIVRRLPTEFELHIPNDLPNLPPPCGEGGSAQSAETGGGWRPQPPDTFVAARAPP